MFVPVRNLRKDRRKQRIQPDARIECRDEIGDHRLGDAGPLDDLVDQDRPPALLWAGMLHVLVRVASISGCFRPLARMRQANAPHVRALLDIGPVAARAMLGLELKAERPRIVVGDQLQAVLGTRWSNS